MDRIGRIAALAGLEAFERQLHVRRAAAEGLTVPMTLLCWLRSLGGFAGVLRRGMRAVARQQLKEAGVPALELLAVNRLVGRALLWMHALRVRLRAETVRLRLPPTHRDTEPDERLLPTHETGRAAPPREAPPGNLLAGEPTAAVVAQICADLREAARLLGKTAAARRIEVIAEDVRALLAPAAAVTGTPPAAAPRAAPKAAPGTAPRAAPRAASRAAPGAQAGAAAAGWRVLAPDSG